MQERYDGPVWEALDVLTRAVVNEDPPLTPEQAEELIALGHPARLIKDRRRKTCAECGEEFIAQRADREYCSPRCGNRRRQRAHRAKKKV